MKAMYIFVFNNGPWAKFNSSFMQDVHLAHSRYQCICIYSLTPVPVLFDQGALNCPLKYSIGTLHYRNNWWCTSNFVVIPSLVVSYRWFEHRLHFQYIYLPNSRLRIYISTKLLSEHVYDICIEVNIYKGK